MIAIIEEIGMPALYALVAKLRLAVCELTKSQNLEDDFPNDDGLFKVGIHLHQSISHITGKYKLSVALQSFGILPPYLFIMCSTLLSRGIITVFFCLYLLNIKEFHSVE
mgnify:CR=1 FL=1